MSSAEMFFLIAQIYIARTLTPLASLCMAAFWLAFAAYRGW